MSRTGDGAIMRALAASAATCLAACGVQITGGGGSTDTTSIATTTSAGGGGAGTGTGTDAGSGGGGGAAPICKADGTLCSRKEECCANACSGKFCGTGAGLCKPGDPPVVVASDPAGIFTFAIDPAYAYFTTPQDGTCTGKAKLYRVSKAGGTPELLATPTQVPSVLAVDETRLYWPDQLWTPCDGTTETGYSVFIAPKTGGTGINTFSIAGNSYPAREIALDDSRLYWINSPSSVYRADKSLGAALPLGWMEGWPESIAIDDTSVFWSCEHGIRTCSKGGKDDPVTIAPYEFRMAQLAADAGALYAAIRGGPDYTVGEVYRLSKDGAIMTKLVATPGQLPARIAIDDDFVYWTSAQPFSAGVPPVGYVTRIAKTGGDAVTLVTGEYPHAVAVDDSCVYWTDSHSLMRAPK